MSGKGARRSVIFLCSVFLSAVLLNGYAYPVRPAAVAAGEPPGRATGSVGQTAAEPTSSNVAFVHQMGGTVGARMVARGNYAYVGEGPRLAVLDVTDPATPTLLGRSAPVSDLVVVQAVQGDYVFTTDTTYFRIFDVSDPAAPAEIAFYDFGVHARDNVEVAGVSGSYAYVSQRSHLRVLDISDPRAPTTVGFYDAQQSLHHLVVEGQVLYLGSGNYLEILDVSEPTRPTMIGRYHSGWGRSMRGRFAVSTPFVYVADDVEGVMVLDVSDPTRVEVEGTNLGPWSPIDLVLDGKLAYVSTLNDGLRIVDVSDPAEIKEVGWYKTWVPVADVDQNRAYLPVNKGLRIVDVVDPTKPADVGFYHAPGAYNHVVVDEAEAILYVHIATTKEAELRAFDVSAPSRPVEIGALRIPYTVMKMVIAGDLLYLAAGDAGLRIVDISDPERLVEIGFFEAPDTVLDVAVAGDNAYLACASAGLAMVDVSNSRTPELLRYVNDEDWYTRAVAAADSCAFFAASSGGLRAIGSGTPTSRCHTGPFGHGAEFGLAVSDGILFVLEDSGLRLFDLSQVLAPIEIEYLFLRNGLNVTARGSRAFVSNGYKGLDILDVYNPEDVKRFGFYDTAGIAVDATILNDDYVFVAGNRGGLSVLRLGPFLAQLPLVLR